MSNVVEYYGENKLYYDIRIVLDQQAELDLYTAISQKQLFAGTHVAPLGHIIFFPCQQGIRINISITTCFRILLINLNVYIIYMCIIIMCNIELINKICLY